MAGRSLPEQGELVASATATTVIRSWSENPLSKNLATDLTLSNCNSETELPKKEQTNILHTNSACHASIRLS